MNTFLSGLIPESNRIDIAFSEGLAQTSILESIYSGGSGFIGAFADNDYHPEWSRKAARYLMDEFLHDTPGALKLFGDVLPSLTDDGAGKCMPNQRHALDLWEQGGRKGPKPYSTAQDFGSCVDASRSEHATTLFGWRAAHPEILRARGEMPEEFRHSAAWYHYGDRGYCSDGWTGSGIATVARRVGEAFRQHYAAGENSADFTDDDQNEKLVARTWCRSGIPSWLKTHTTTNHPYADGAITAFQGGLKELRAAFAVGGVAHTSGTRTSGGSKPFMIGPVGPHMQSAVGADDSEDFRRYCKDKLGTPMAKEDFGLIMHQTWGGGWRGECDDSYWPFGTDASGKVWTQKDINGLALIAVKELVHEIVSGGGWGWGPKPEGAWVWRASDVLAKLSIDFIWLPWVKGFPATVPPPPPPPPPGPGIDLTGELSTDVPTAIRGTLVATGTGQAEFIIVPDQTRPGKYVPVRRQA